MDSNEVLAALAGLPLGGLRFFGAIGSTNDEALAWCADGAPDLSLVVADEQTAGRGRSGRRWFTPPGAALAFSLVLRPSTFEHAVPSRLVGLGAVALVDVLGRLGLSAQVKWPNDILLNGRKMAGILAESAWAGNALDASILGIGLNISAAAVPPPEQLAFPATSLESELGGSVDRLAVLKDLLLSIVDWRSRIASPAFVEAWENALAYRGQRVMVGSEDEPQLVGTLLGLEADGSLRIMADNMPTTVHFGEIHLRPMDDKIR